MRHLVAGILLLLTAASAAATGEATFTPARLDSLSAALDAYPEAAVSSHTAGIQPVSHDAGNDSYLMERVLRSLRDGSPRPDALADLGGALIAAGHRDLGQRCISLAVEAAMEIDPSVADQQPMTDGYHRIHQMSYYWFIVVFVLMLAAIVLALNRQLKVRRLQERVDGAEARVKHVVEESVRTNQNLVMLTFLSLEQVKDYSIHVSRKLKVGQVKDLIADIENGGFLQRQNEKYLESFDSTFLSSYPDFVAKLNTLFKPDSQITPPAPDRLTPELRIAALMRLGIQDSARMAQALALSLNTIYTYRNRLRSRAIDRDNFESDLLKIV